MAAGKNGVVFCHVLDTGDVTIGGGTDRIFVDHELLLNAKN